MRAARAEGIPVGLFRPITLSPFPGDRIAELAKLASTFLVVEMNAGQMLEDIRLAVAGRVPVDFYGRMGGIVPFPDEILGEIHRIAKEPVPIDGDPRLRWLQRVNWGKNGRS